MQNIQALINAQKAISSDIGILTHYVELPRYPTDPKIINCGIWACNSQYINGEKYSGRSGGCGYEWENTMLSTVGETMERYASAFYDKGELLFSSYKNLSKNAVHPKEYALFHDEQFKNEKFILKKFDENVELSWFPCIDLIDGKENWCPGQVIYMPFSIDKNFINVNTSTGLAAHTDLHKAILSALYECIERDSFMITWMHNLALNKIIINKDIRIYIDSIYPKNYEWHLFDVTYDLEVPSVFGICFGENEFGKFVAVGSATRGTFADATKKVIQEIGQAIPYFRWILGEKKNWQPADDFNKLMSFEDHSIFYLKKQGLWSEVFDCWTSKKEDREIDFLEVQKKDDITEIKNILQIMANKNYNVLFKDLTTTDVWQIGYKSVKVFIPQLIQMSGAYTFYFNGSERLFSVPEKLGLGKKTYHDLNKFPHPFP
jgi:ribosomal protein S12 methylthiotransferase accessory factor